MRICKYFGGKSGRIAQWIGSHIPEHSVYVEPFGGMASVLLNKRRSNREIYNDLSPSARNMVIMLRDHPGALIEDISAGLREWGTHSFNQWVKELPGISGDPIADATHFYLHSQCSFMGGGLRWSSGLSPSAKKPDPSHLWDCSRRLAKVEVKGENAISLIKAFPKDLNILFYVDPPYLNSSRKSKDNRVRNQTKSLTRRQYAYELPENDHRNLAIALQGRSVVLSGYRSDLYQELYQGWSVQSLRWAGDTEFLWISPEAQCLVPQLKLIF